MIKSLVILLMLIGWSVTANATTKAVCKIMRGQVDEIQSQLPVQVDYSTVLLGATALYSGSICNITYKYLIDKKKYIHFLSSQNGLADFDNELFISSPEGKEAIKKQLYDMGVKAKNSSLKELAKHPGIKVLYQHEFNDLQVGIFTTVVVDTSR